MFALKRLMAAASLVTLVLLPACSDSSSPSNVDPQALGTSVSAATGTFLQNAAFQSVSLLANHFPQFAAAQLVRGTLPRAGQMVGVRTGAAARSAFRIAASLQMNPEALFPANVLGKTLDWDTSSNAYVIGNAPGAPANGMRLTLYFANPSTGLPFKPLQVLGYLELTDLSTPQVNRIGVLLTLAQTTIASYDISVVAGTTTTAINATGFIKSGTSSAQATFNLNDQVTNATQVIVSTDDITGYDGTTIHVEMTIGQSSDNVLARISQSHASIELTASGDILGGQGPLWGAVKFNNTTVANLGGTVGTPTLTGVGGHAFTADQTTSTLSIFVAAVTIVFDVSNGVFAPGQIVFHN